MQNIKKEIFNKVFSGMINVRVIITTIEPSVRIQTDRCLREAKIQNNIKSHVWYAKYKR